MNADIQSGKAGKRKAETEILTTKIAKERKGVLTTDPPSRWLPSSSGFDETSRRDK
jgi:hypothetical protein